MADKTIDSLPEAISINANDLLVMQQAGSAKSVTGQLLENWLVELADGHGGVQSIIKTDTTGLVDTYTITYADLTTSTFTVTNGAKGDKGDKGDTGDLNAVRSCTTQYASSDDGTTHPTSGWSTTANPVKGKYLWTQTELVFADASSTTFYNVTYCGTDGTGAVNSVDGKTGDVDLSGTYLALADTKSVGSNDYHVYFGADGKPVASDTAMSSKQDVANMVTTITASSDDSHYPTAKAVYANEVFWDTNSTSGASTQFTHPGCYHWYDVTGEIVTNGHFLLTADVLDGGNIRLTALRMGLASIAGREAVWYRTCNGSTWSAWRGDYYTLSGDSTQMDIEGRYHWTDSNNELGQGTTACFMCEVFVWDTYSKIIARAIWDNNLCYYRTKSAGVWTSWRKDGAYNAGDIFEPSNPDLSCAAYLTGLSTATNSIAAHIFVPAPLDARGVTWTAETLKGGLRCSVVTSSGTSLNGYISNGDTATYTNDWLNGSEITKVVITGECNGFSVTITFSPRAHNSDGSVIPNNIPLSFSINELRFTAS